MKKLEKSVLASVLIEVLEDTAFVFAEIRDDERQDREEIDVAASIGFNGEVNGEFSLFVPRDIALEVAANMLGLDPNEEEADEKRSEAVTEVLNISCGLLLEKWLGKSVSCDMGIPKTVVLSEEKWAERRSDMTTMVGLITRDGQKIDAAVRIF